jgi:hypothetical protein
LTGELDKLETVLTVRLGRVDGVENPDDDDDASVARLSRVGGVGDPADKDGTGAVSVCHRFVARPALSISYMAAFFCLSSQSVERLCTCFSPVVSFLLVASSAV